MSTWKNRLRSSSSCPNMADNSHTNDNMDNFKLNFLESLSDDSIVKKYQEILAPLYKSLKVSDLDLEQQSRKASVRVFSIAYLFGGWCPDLCSLLPTTSTSISNSYSPFTVSFLDWPDSGPDQRFLTAFTCYTKDNRQGCFRHSNWFSLRRLGPWMNHLPPAW